MKGAVAVAVVLFACAVAQAQTQTLVIDSDVEQAADLQRWWSDIQPRLAGISLPNEQITIRIHKGLPSEQFSADPCSGEIWFDGKINPNVNRDDLANGVYQSLTWDLIVAGYTPCRDLPDARTQYWAALDDKIVRIYQSTGTTSNVLAFDLVSNSKTGVDSHGHNVSLQVADDASGRLGLLSRGDFRSYDEVITRAKTLSQDQIVPVLDSRFAKVNGVLPSTFIKYSRMLALSASEMADGTFFQVTTDAVNPGTLDPIYFKREKGQMSPVRGDVRLGVSNAVGTRIGGYDRLTVNPPCPADSCLNFVFRPISVKPDPDGAYQLSGCVLDGDACGELNDVSYYIIYAKNRAGKMFIIANGPDFAGFSQQNLQVLKSSRPVQVENLPGLLVVSGLEIGDDITVTDSKTVRTFTRDLVSSVNLYRRRDAPLLRAVTNAAGVSGKVSPASVAVLWGLGLSHNDPVVSDGFLPAEGCAGNAENDQGRTRVVFTQFGKEYEASFYYCSSVQLNVGVPAGLASGKAEVSVDLNGTRSNALSLEVKE